MCSTLAASTAMAASMVTGWLVRVALDADVAVGDQGQAGVAQAELAGQVGLGVLRHVDDVDRRRPSTSADSARVEKRGPCTTTDRCPPLRCTRCRPGPGPPRRRRRDRRARSSGQ